MCDVIVVGAGVSGLTAARNLEGHGLKVMVLERSRGVGGRCATRRVNDVPVDHGVPFLHGRDPRFVAELGATAASRRIDWPRTVSGHGTPCRPQAFAEHETRLALDEGVSQFAKHLAAGLDVRLRSQVVELKGPSSSGRAALPLSVVLDSGETLKAPAIILAMPIPQASRLWEPILQLAPDLETNMRLLELPQIVPCLAVIAVYSGAAPALAWEAFYPSDSRPIQAVFLDSSKRAGQRTTTLVFHARPAFSKGMMDEDEHVWTDAMLADAAERLGSWAARPQLVQAHRWRFARVQPASELAAPLTFRVGERGILGLCGDAFDTAGGVEGAYLSGLALATKVRSLAAKEDRQGVTDQS